MVRGELRRSLTVYAKVMYWERRAGSWQDFWAKTDKEKDLAAGASCGQAIEVETPTELMFVYCW